MVEETLVKETLTSGMIEAGAELTRLLDRTDLEVTASFWLYLPDLNTWRLLIASPKVRAIGPKKVYEKIQKKLLRMRENSVTLELNDVGVLEENAPIVSLLRAAVKTGQGISGIRFTKNTINGQFIEDTYIYRII